MPDLIALCIGIEQFRRQLVSIQVVGVLAVRIDFDSSVLRFHGRHMIAIPVNKVKRDGFSSAGRFSC